ncbi:hypothetical protein F5050DRAFT_1807255 [Lentinula boryana]|uniref:JmjC domain-containing protein n=1 Tax=Lentinula boryana TaxID=40481 RepID=A0ABQ8QEW1_9AGAR|nr:hypothetical protein F5050DRAFT_1807255 [Lentinula boryana]
MPPQLEDELSTIPTPPPASRRYVSFGRRGTGEDGVYTSMPFKKGGVTLATELPIVVQLNTIGDAQKLYHKIRHLFYNKNNLPSRDLARLVLNSKQYEKTMKLFDDNFGQGDICWWVVYSARSVIYTSSVEAFYTMRMEYKIEFRFAYGFLSFSGAFNALLNSSSAASNMALVYDPSSNRVAATKVLKTVMSNLLQIPLHVKNDTTISYATHLPEAIEKRREQKRQAWYKYKLANPERVKANQQKQNQQRQRTKKELATRDPDEDIEALPSKVALNEQQKEGHPESNVDSSIPSTSSSSSYFPTSKGGCLSPNHEPLVFNPISVARGSVDSSIPSTSSLSSYFPTSEGGCLSPNHELLVFNPIPVVQGSAVTSPSASPFHLSIGDAMDQPSMFCPMPSASTHTHSSTNTLIIPTPKPDSNSAAPPQAPTPFANSECASASLESASNHQSLPWKTLPLPVLRSQGQQVHKSAEIIVWPCGWETVVPTAIQDGVNVLEPDADCVRWMADPRNAVPSECSNVKYLDKAAYGKKNKGALIDDIHKLNGQNYVVVVSGGVDDHGKKFESYEDVKEEYSLAVDKSLDLQYYDLIKRAQDGPTGYHIPTTVSDFIENINNTDIIGMILDIPICKQALPEPYNQIDDSAIAVQQMRSSQSAKVVGLNLTIHLQHLLSPTWALLHHAGTFTNAHQDADGFSVAGQVLGDRDDPQPKMWALMSFKDPSVAAQAHEKIAQRISDLCIYQNDIAEDDENVRFWDDGIWQECEVEIIYLRPGDMFFQPPGALHLVYTPRACVASGGHFFCYHSMHLTEWTRKIQHYKSHTITNQAPPRTKDLLVTN